MLNSKKTVLFLTLSALSSAGQAQNRDIDTIPMPANNANNVAIRLNVTDGRDTVHINDRIRFCFEVNTQGYISLWDIGTSGKIRKIYPFSEQSSKHYVNANQEECVGDNRFRVTGPTGTENVVLYWTRSPDAQIKADSYQGKQEFIKNLEKSARRAVNSGSWNDWATEHVTFEIIGENDTPNNADNTVNSNHVAHTQTPYSNIYAVAFGSNVDGLRKTNDDAGEFLKLAQESFGIPKENIRLYTNAYRKDFEEAFEWLRQSAGENDLVLTFYSGHGAQIPDDNGDEADHYDEALVPYDLNNEDNLNNPHSFIRDDELKDWYNSLNAAAVVALFDACHSGGMYKNFSQSAVLNARVKYFNKGKLAGAASLNGTRAKKMSRDIIDTKDGLGNGKTKYTMISAAGEMESALELPNQGGIFTINLSDILQNDKHGKNWEEMEQILSRNVQRMSAGRQTPVAIDPGHILSELQFK